MPKSPTQPDPTAARTPGPGGEPAAVDRFIEAWGRMGTVWGISRTMAEVHALLYITGEPMCTDDVMARLEISRGNASMSLRALLDWGVIARVHRRGDRKEYFQAEQDVWTIFRAIVRERVKREVDPLLVNLHEIRDHTRAAAAKTDAETDAETDGRTGAETGQSEINDRLDAMIDFFEMTSRLGDRFIGPTGPGLRLAATLLSKTPTLRKGKDDEGVRSDAV